MLVKHRRYKVFNMLGHVFVFVAIASFAVGLLVQGQSKCGKDISNIGREFVVSLPEPYSVENNSHVIHIASSENGSVNITTHMGSSVPSTTHYDITPGTFETRTNFSSLVQTTSGVQKKVIVIRSDVDIAVFVTYAYNSFAASFVALPLHILLQHYVVSSYIPYSSQTNDVSITALVNGTSINITDSDGHTHVQHNLDYLESYNEVRSTDLSGVTITSNKPVSIVSGNTCVEIPVGIYDCDPLLDSPIPVEYWGKEFITPPLPPKKAYIIRIFADSATTTVHLTYANNTHHVNMTFSGMHELLLQTDPTYISTDIPVRVIQYSLSQNYDYINGDPFMVSVPAISHYTNSYVFPSPLTDMSMDQGFVNRLTVTMDTRYASGLLLDGKNVTGTWTTLTNIAHPYSNYGTLTFEVTGGNHTLSHISEDVKFAGLLYGLKRYGGFGFSLGFAFSRKEDVLCYNGGSCGHMENTCHCSEGYNGQHCENDVNECAGNTDNCHANAACTNTDGSFKCACNSGYTGNGVICRDVNECTSGKNNCHAYAACTNTDGSFTCACNSGYTGDGVTCTDVDECTGNTDNCHAYAVCTNTAGSFTCACNSGYTGDGVTCTDIDECTRGSDNCHANAACTNTDGSFTCACNSGYTGDGVTCTAVHAGNGPVCFSCEDAVGLSYCDSIEYCRDHETCFVQRYATKEGHVRFRSGCMDRQTCALHQENAPRTPTSPCLQCCEGNYCNSAGCGDLGLPPREMRGPICLDCAHVGSTRECDLVTLCSSDELCSIEEFTWGDQHNFHLGCKSTHQCASGSRAMLERSVPVCHQCCSNDLCNANCTAIDVPIIVG